MTGDPLFWMTLSLYFLTASAGRLIPVIMKKKTALPVLVYLILWALSTIGLWLNYSPLFISDLLSGVSLFFAAAGFCSGILFYLHPAAFLIPLFFSLLTHTPLAPVFTEESSIAGTLLFYPSPESSLALGWTPEEGVEEVFQLEGSSAGVLFVRKELPRQFFFLKEEFYPSAVLSRQIPVSLLNDADPLWYYSLDDSVGKSSSLYSVSYPSVRFFKPGFFNARVYRIDKGDLLIERR